MPTPQPPTLAPLLGAAILTLAVAVALVPPGRAQEGPPPIDLSLDADGDGVPDAIAALVADVDAIAARAQANGSLAALEQTELERLLADFDARLPYSPETRERQRRAAELSARLPEASPEEAEAINAEIVALGEAMQSDPNYALVGTALQSVLAPALAAGPRYSLYLPLLRSGEGGAAPTADPGPATTAQATSAPRWESLQRGDIMFMNAGSKVNNFAYAMEFNHVGTFDGQGQVYEVNPGLGARRMSVNRWMERNQYIGLGRNRERSQSSVVQALDWAKGFYGIDGRTPYSYVFPDKWSDSRLYCSQLVWKIHLRAGSDLDSNHPRYIAWFVSRWGFMFAGSGAGAYAFAVSMVAPDEIALSSRVNIYNRAWTR